MGNRIVLSEEVSAALGDGRPLVALESTIISHGMPYPRNVETALECQRLVREGGAVPATCAIVEGRPRAGLTDAQIERLGRLGPKAKKCSVRDIPVIIAGGGWGATTVAATMFLAKAAGIHVLATGGIGGVHRGGETSMDISADLEELGRTPMAVVCAGAKSVLDIGRTLEYLETKGVAVIGYGTDEMPAFYTRSSGFRVPNRFDSPEAIAGALRVQLDMGLSGALLIVNPIPPEYSMDGNVIDAAIARALARAEERGITGRDVTPFLLAEVERLTGGDSLDSNIALVYNNVRLAAQIASCLSTQRGASLGCRPILPKDR